MQFDSNDFLIFFGLFLVLYAGVRNSLNARNLLIVAASYLFYGWWDYRFLGLLLLTSTGDFLAGYFIHRSTSESRRRWLLAISILLNLGVLFSFKYFDFFRESLENLLEQFGHPTRWRGLNWTLPVGISFYTFQSISYVVDVYRRELPATGNFFRFLAYVSFFPQLVAGPIERAAHLLPQFERALEITRPRLEAGIWLVLSGMFKKVVVADSLAPLVEMVYQAPLGTVSGVAVMLGTLAFAFQIYGDFSGYSDIARGTASLLGFDLMRNFRAPYLAADLRDFWRRWHVSLSSWLRDYLYIPLGGNRVPPGRASLNLFVTMVLAGLWHGASATFLLWGIWLGSGLVINFWWRQKQWLVLPRPWSWLLTMVFVLYGWLLFRAGSLAQVLAFTEALGDWSLPRWFVPYATSLLVLALPVVLLDVLEFKKDDPCAPLAWPAWAKGLLQGALLYLVCVFWTRESPPQFIYFQF